MTLSIKVMDTKKVQCNLWFHSLSHSLFEKSALWWPHNNNKYAFCDSEFNSQIRLIKSNRWILNCSRSPMPHFELSYETDTHLKPKGPSCNPFEASKCFYLLSVCNTHQTCDLPSKCGHLVIGNIQYHICWVFKKHFALSMLCLPTQRTQARHPNLLYLLVSTILWVRFLCTKTRHRTWLTNSQLFPTFLHLSYECSSCSLFYTLYEMHGFHHHCIHVTSPLATICYHLIGSALSDGARWRQIANTKCSSFQIQMWKDYKLAHNPCLFIYHRVEKVDDRNLCKDW